MRYRYQSEPKPFAYITIPKKKPVRTDYTEHWRFSGITGHIDLKIEVISDYLFVSSGGYDFREQDGLVYYSFFRSGGKIVLPGTSIKGAVRSIVESISNSCVSQVARRERRRTPKTHRQCSFCENLCPACKIFGTTKYRGKVSFSDAKGKNLTNLEIVKIAELFSPRIVPQNSRKFYKNKKYNPVGNLRPEKNYRFVEAVKKGDAFDSTLYYWNLTLDELSLVLHAMGVNQNYTIKIGGAKPRCFGTVMINPTSLTLVRSPLELPETKEGPTLKNYISEILSYGALIVPDLLNQLRIEFSASDETCPRGIY